MPQNRRSELVQLIESSADSLKQMDPAAQIVKKSPEIWTNQEILGHLIDSAYNNHRRIVLASNQEDLIFDGYPQDHWVQAHAYNKSDWISLINTWKSVNLHLAQLIGNLPEQLLRRPTTNHNFHEIGFRPIEKGAPSSLDFLIEDYIAHLQHHLNQIIS